MKKLIILFLSAHLCTSQAFSQGKEKSPASAKAPGSEVFTYVEQMPEPTFDLGQYLSKMIEYPKDAQKLKKEGRVVVKFVVMTTGKIDSVKLVNAVFPSLDSTALSVVRKMPRWKPGMNKSKPVPVYYTLPIKFTL